MTSETDYLNSFLTSPFELSLTIASAQRPRRRPGPLQSWEPGLASFGWCSIGHRQHTGNVVTGLTFSSLVWFSDRHTNPGASPIDWQQFAAQEADPTVFTFTIDGEHVRLQAELTRWGSRWESNSFAFDPQSEQLSFRIPGAGAGAPPAILLSSFGPGAGIL